MRAKFFVPAAKKGPLFVYGVTFVIQRYVIGAGLCMANAAIETRKLKRKRYRLPSGTFLNGGGGYETGEYKMIKWFKLLAVYIRFRLRGAPLGFALACLPAMAKPFLPLRYLTALELFVLRAIPSLGSFWLGYDQDGFDTPDDEELVCWVLSDGDDCGFAISQAASIPDTFYVYVFNTLVPSTDANGEHMGVHPCAAVRVAKRDFKWMGVVR